MLFDSLVQGLIVFQVFKENIIKLFTLHRVTFFYDRLKYSYSSEFLFSLI